ncbi:MAG TPA: aminopeptidase P family N-terminal domain-containing protein, partial [Chloroflexota bacterium]|nr:aminopeptidase P family N-terminal domain-containing protein [Chloroflexota bacterium]
MDSDPQRDRQIRDALVEARLDALICRLPENVVCLTGYYPHVGLSFVVYPTVGAPVLIVPRPEVEDADLGLVGDIRPFDTWRIPDLPPLESVGRILRDVAGELNLRGGRIGFEGS